MKKIITLLFIFICMLIPFIGVKAQVVTVTNPTNVTPNLAATYTSLANAITALNTITAISGPITITLNTANPQTAPVGGYVINFTAATTVTRTITITGNNNVITASGALISGTLTDAIFKIIGSNFVTIQNFTMQENPANTTIAAATNNMTEWGVALLYATATKGAQNNTIKNNTISLNKAYSNTFGVYSNTRHTATNVALIADASSTLGANSNNDVNGNAINNVNMGIAFIGSGNAAAMDLGNNIGGIDATTANTITNWGGIVAASGFIANPASCYGIFSNNQKNENISFNTITSATVSGTPVAMRGVFKTFSTVPTGTFTSGITNNVIRINHNFASGILEGIRSDGITSSVNGATININNNRFQNITVSAAASSTEIVGISNDSQCGLLNINDNIFRGNTSTATTGGFTAIKNTGTVVTAVNINNNKIGDAGGNAISFSAASLSGIVRGIINDNVLGIGASLSMNGNNFQGFIQSVAAATDYIFIECLHQGAAAVTNNINNNTFTNLQVNASGNVTFISRKGVMNLNIGFIDNCNDNSIVTAFSKPVAGGTVTLYNCGDASSGGLLNTMSQVRNNFSNITLTGATIMAGWNNISGTANGPTKFINDNVFSNWTCGSGAVKVIQSDLGGNNSTINDNIISGISAASILTGITIGSGNSGITQSCSGNTISGLSSTGGTLLGISGGSTSVTTIDIANNIISGLSTSTSVSTISGIRMLTASTANIAKNKIFDLSTSNVSSPVNGMDVAAAAVGTYNISNNMIGDLRADITSSTIAIRGINLLSVNAGTAYNIFYNTVYINALSGGTNFGTTALTATTSATAANGALNLRNNILVNTSLAKGTGLTAVYKRTSAVLTNFTNSSNNNIFYAGTPSATNLIFTDGINNDQTLLAYKARVTPRDAASFTELPPFISTVGASPDFLHLDPIAATQAENGAVNIATYTDDFDGTIRQGNAGYGGSGTAPDIGADELNGSVVVVTNFNLTTPALAATYTSLANAITALNTVTSMLNGTVTITLMPGNSQTAPVGGYSITTNAATALTRNIVITGSNNTITANNNLVAGVVTDAIFKIIGSNFLTISNFVMRENPLNVTTDTLTNDMTEWGVALLKASVTNGAQGNTIQNNTISLNRLYSNSFGIYSNARHTATNVSVLSDASSSIGANSNNDIYGNTISNVNMGIAFIGSGNAAAMDLTNDIGGLVAATGNTISNWGGQGAASSFASNADGCYGIYINHQKTENVSFNTITSASLTGTPVSIRGIYKTYTSTQPTGTFTSAITNNTISITDGFSGSGIFNGICNEGIIAGSNSTININNNILLNNSVANSVTEFIGIANSAEPIILNINNNIFRGNTSSASTAGFTGILNTGNILSTFNINNNKLGDASGNAITFSNATTGAINGISCPVVGDDVLLSISGNNFQGFVQNVIGSGNHNYINFVHAPTFTTTDNINSNTFTNLTANTTGNVTFIARSGVMALNAGVIENCNNNSIVTAFNKPDGNGTVKLYNAASASLTGNTMVQTGNNFSNITFPNVNAIVGWNNSEGEAVFGTGPNKTINSNTFSNWNLGIGDVTVIQIDKAGTSTSVSLNNISSITSSSFSNNVTGIFLGSSISTGLLSCSSNAISGISVTNNGNITGIKCQSFSNKRNISGNTISGFSTAGFSGIAKGISVLQGSDINIFRNKIVDLNAAKVMGIDIPAAVFGVFTIHNNYIGNLAGNNAFDANAIRGISIESVEASNTFDVYYNTIYLNTSTPFGAGSSGIYLTGSSNGPVSLRNNIIVNTSTTISPGLSVAYRRSASDLTNYSPSSNNNIFYSGTPSATNLIFYDGSNSDQLLSTYKTRVGPTRDAGSFSGMPAFLSTVSASPNFLHLDPAIASLAESRAVNIATYTIDYDLHIRQGNAGYVGTGTAPDIGADEIAGIFHETTVPVISYTDIPSISCIATPKTITGVIITDATGVPLSGVLRPRIYYRKNAGAWFSQPGTNTAGTATNSTWSFTIIETDMGGVALGDVVSYFIVAQDLMPVANVGLNPATGSEAETVNNILIPPTTPKTYTITTSLGGLYTVGSGGNFTTLTAAVNAYNNACTLTSAVVFELIPAGASPETYPIIIRNHVDASAVKTLTIRPSTTTSISYSTNNDTEIFKLDGARFVTIDGRQGGAGTTKSINIINAGNLGAAFRFINDAQHNTIKYCDIRSQSKSVTGGTIVFSTAATGGTGNDHNIIDNNQIKDPSLGLEPINAIFSFGTASAANDSITISNNNIFNYYHATNSTAGIFASSNNNGWTITGNRLFQEATRLYTSANNHYGIKITSGAGHTISNNVIGFDNQSGTGSTKMIGNSVTLTGFPTSYAVTGTAVALKYTGIEGSFDPAGTVSTIDGNTIGGISMYTSSNASTGSGMLCGIAVKSGKVNIGAVTGNTIGASSGNNSLYAATTTTGGTIVGIYTNTTGTTAIQNNNIGGITASGTTNTKCGGITAINTEGIANYSINNNFIGNAVAANLRIGLVTAGASLSNGGTLVSTAGTIAALKGIINKASGNSLSITGNTLRGWSSSSTEAAISGIESPGILTGVNPSVTINNNFLGTAGTVWGTSVVSSNKPVNGISLVSRNQTSTNVKYNDFRGLGFNTNSLATCILVSDTTAANNITSITGNTFTNLSVNATSLALISHQPDFASNVIINIDSNKTIGAFSFTGYTINMIGISNFFSSIPALKTTIKYNEFSNVTLTLADDINSGGAIISEHAYSKEIHVDHNTIQNVVQNAANFTGIFVNIRFAISSDTSTVFNNFISNIAVNGIANSGIQLDGGSALNPFLISNNIIKNLSLARTSDTTGTGVIAIGIVPYNNSTPYIISANEITALSSTIDSSIVSGIMFNNINSNTTYSFKINKNKIAGLSVTKTGARVAGIYSFLYMPAGPFGERRISILNNIIGDLRAPAAGNISRPSINGILIENNTLNDIIDIHHNTIDLRASSSHTAFSSAALYVDAQAKTRSTGNIINNISTPGATGKTVAYWRGGTSLTNYVADYNSLYAGTPAVNRLIYFDGTNSDQTLAAYKARVAVQETNSVSVLPVFASLIGTNAGYLHLDPNTNCALMGKAIDISGFDEIILDFDNDPRPYWFNGFTELNDIGADEVAKYNTWTGANSTSWNNPLNWSLGTVPNGTDRKVTIPAAPSNQPIIAVGETFQVRDIAITAPGSLTNNGILKIGGRINGSTATINNLNAGIVVGSIEMIGLCSQAQSLVGNRFVGNNINNLSISTEVTIPATVGQGVNLWGTLNFPASFDTLTTNGNITLKSTAASTAAVGVILGGNFVKGDVTVERFINTGTSGGAHAKSWQFLSTPTTGQTILQAWQENGTTPAGFGTIITGTGTGFDITTALPSLKFFNDATVNWTAVTNTNNALQNKLGYMLFVRGDRTVTTSAAAANATVLRSKGVIFQDSNPPPSVSLTADKFQAVGNPYAARIEFNKVRTILSAGVLDVFYVWDPTLSGNFGLGGYQTISGVAGYVPTVGTPPSGNPSTVLYPAGVAAPFIESGQAFFVKCRPTIGGIMSFNELNKVTGNRLVTRPTGNNSNTDLPSNRGFISATLFTAQGNIADGNIVAFENGLGNELNEYDALKIINPGENFGIQKSDSLLAVEARDEVMDKDTIFYQLNNLKNIPYQIRFAPVNMPANLSGFLIDRFNNISTAISLTDSSFIDFIITDDPASKAADRFILVFKQASVVPVKILYIAATRNSDQSIAVLWKVENELNLLQYEIEHSENGRAFSKLAALNPINNNAGSADYTYKDEQPFSNDNFYRIKAISKDGQIQFSAIVKVAPVKMAPSIAVFPNPIVDKKINVRFLNQPVGNYQIQLTNKLGQVVYSNSIYINRENVIKTIQPLSIIATGNYQLSVTGEDGKRMVETVVVQ